MRTGRHRHHWAIRLYDRVYRFWHRLDTPGADLPPVLRIEIRRSFRTVRLSAGVVVRRGDRIGVLHLNNERIAALHSNGLSLLAIGLEVRRAMMASLHELATLMAPGSQLADLHAVVAVTIFHHGLRRLGFEIDPRGLTTPGLTTAYQRALLASFHPSGRLRILGMTSARAERGWISREKLRALYASVVRRAG